MYYLKKTVIVSASHKLNLTYDSKCSKTHGHNWIITVYCKSKHLDSNGMVTDFSVIKEVVNRLDHEHINDVIQENPTAENIAAWVYKRVPFCYKVKVVETSGNEVIYTKSPSEDLKCLKESLKL